jgi:hypothetical protein
MRFRAAQVLGLSRALWGDLVAPDGAAPPPPDVLVPPPRQPGPRLPLGSARSPAVPAPVPAPSSPALSPPRSASDQPSSSQSEWRQSAELPPGWMARRTVAQSGRVYFSYRSPDGVLFRSLALAREAVPADAVGAPPAASQAPVAAAPLVVGAHPADVGSLDFRFPEDLGEHTGYYDRPSRRPPPAARR